MDQQTAINASGSQNSLAKPSSPGILIIGSGSWATALAKIILYNRESIYWWVRKEATIESFKANQTNPNHLGSIHFDTGRIRFFKNINKAIAKADILVFAVPSAYLTKTLAHFTGSLEGKTVISAIKGMVPEENLSVTEFFQKRYGVNPQNLGIISGPCHAEEVALKKLSFLTIASENPDLANQVSSFLTCKFIRTSTSDDVIGAEYAVIMKNIFAIAAGIAHGLGYGDNFLAVLISNALQEMKRFTDAMHPIRRDIKDSAYLGDLLVTAYSKFSRNRLFGSMIGQGYSVRAAQLEMNMVAEGYFAVKAIHAILQNHQIEMPITDSVYKILYERFSPSMAFRFLSDRMR